MFVRNFRRAPTTGSRKHGEILRWLKEIHGMSHGDANYIAKAALAADDDDDGKSRTDPSLGGS